MGIIISTIFAFANINKETIASGVKIEGIDVSGLSADEAKGKLETIYKEKLETEIPVQYNEYESTINANLLINTKKKNTKKENILAHVKNMACHLDRLIILLPLYLF